MISPSAEYCQRISASNNLLNHWKIRFIFKTIFQLKNKKKKHSPSVFLLFKRSFLSIVWISSQQEGVRFSHQQWFSISGFSTQPLLIDFLGSSKQMECLKWSPADKEQHWLVKKSARCISWVSMDFSKHYFP